MVGDLLLIGKTGAQAARAALDVTAQNIANANNADYTRRTVALAEAAATGGIGRSNGVRLAGVRIDGITRTASAFLQSEARRTASDTARADTQLAGLRDAEAAVETAGIYPALVTFEAGLARVASDPLSAPLRTQVLADARGLTAAFGIAAAGLDSTASGLQLGAQADVAQVGSLTGALADINRNIARTQDGTVGRAVLLDQRDAALASLSRIAGISARFDDAGRVSVRLGDAAGPVLVSGSTAASLAVAWQADGAPVFAVDGQAASVVAGDLAGKAQALGRIGELRQGLDGVADRLIAAGNGAQAGGVAADGAPGQPLFSGAGAAGIALALASGDQLATAPAGSAANSRDTGNLASLRAALATGGPAAAMDGLLFGLSSEIAGRTITRDALAAIADGAGAALDNETAVDLDHEAAGLVRFQQAFQASGRVIQVASDIFDTLLAIR